MNRRQFLGATVGAAVALRGLANDKPLLAAEAAAAEKTSSPATAVAAVQHAAASARQAAFDVLQPTPRQLQHGLELHAAGPVVESYGFSPRSAPDGDALRAALEGGATPLELEDLRTDQMMTRCITDAAQRAEYLAAWEAAGVTCILQNAGEECQDPLRLLRRLAHFTHVTDMLRDHVFRAVTPEDIVRAHRQRQHCLYFSGNAVPLTQRWVDAGSELDFVRLFFQLGVRMMHVTYNRRNMLGDGCAEPANGGLSDFGRAAIAEMNRVGVIPDVAHSGWQTSLETAQVSRRPVVASHTACAGLNRHIRGKPDNVIKAICDGGGLIGICSIRSFLGGQGDLSAMLDHIDYAVKRFGAEHVAIGTDVAYLSRDDAREMQKVPRGRPARKRFESFWPADAFPLPGEHPSLAWLNWPMFTVGMVQRGHRDDAIRKILGDNVLRVARAALGATA